MPYYIVTHRFDSTKRYRAEAASKTKLKKSLPRYTEVAGYLVYFDVREVDDREYRRMSHLPDVSLAEA